MQGLILLTGAAGKTGRAVLSALKARGQAVRAFVRRPQQAAELKSLGADEALVGDLANRADLERAAQGAAAIYHIPPNMHPDEVELGEMLIAAAQQAGVRKLVYHSVLYPQTEKMPHHWHKLRVEERLLESGLPYAILQPTAYMQNLLGVWEAVVNEGIYRVPYPADARTCLVDLGDVAEAAVRVLLEDDFLYGSYELVGTPPLTPAAIAGELTTTLGRAVRVEVVPLADWRAQAEKSGALSAYAVDTLLRMFRYYAEYGLVGSPFVLTAILGRKPRTLGEFLEGPSLHPG